MNSSVVSRRALVLLATMLLAACGGGGGGGAPAPTPTPPPPPAPPPIAGPATATLKSVIGDIDIGDSYLASEVSVDASGQAIVRTKIEIVFRPTATVGQVNGLLVRINATITSALAGLEGVVVRVPDPGSLAALDTLVASIEAEPFVWFARRAILPATPRLPVNIPDIAAAEAHIRPLLATRVPSAFNVRELRNHIVSVIVADYFGDGPPGSHFDYSYKGNTVSDFKTGDLHEHGYHVTGIIAANFEGDTTDEGRITGMAGGGIGLSVVDLKKGDPLDAHNRIINLARDLSSGPTLVVNTSLGYQCTVDATCIALADVRAHAAWWALKVRKFDLESEVLHLTAAGNIEPPSNAADAAVAWPPAAAALRTDLVDGAGAAIPALTNTLAVENVRAIESTPFGEACLNNGSFHGGHIAGIGTDYRSLTTASGVVKSFSGTSMATPQVAGLAAYLLAIKPSLTPQALKALLIASARGIPAAAQANCSTWAAPAPLIDAYAATLALDSESALASSNLSGVRVRGTLLDTNADEQFRNSDLTALLAALDAAAGQQDYGRYDLNGDGHTGGTNRARFDLDVDGVIETSVAMTMGTATVGFDERAASDYDVACYYAYTPLYTDNTAGLAALLAPYRQLGLCGQLNPVYVEAVVGTFAGNTVPISIALTGPGGVPLPGLFVEFAALGAQGGSVTPTSAVTNAAGTVEVTATLAPGATNITVQVTVREGPGGAILAEQLVDAASDGDLLVVLDNMSLVTVTGAVENLAIVPDNAPQTYNGTGASLEYLVPTRRTYGTTISAAGRTSAAGDPARVDFQLAFEVTQPLTVPFEFVALGNGGVFFTNPNDPGMPLGCAASDASACPAPAVGEATLLPGETYVLSGLSSNGTGEFAIELGPLLPQ